MRNAEYWKIRFVELEEASNKYGLETYMQIEETFESAQRKIQKEIDAWYGRYARNNGITMQEARKLLSANELKEFRWDVNEYIKYGRQNALNQQWIKELENASARVHISRLEALKLRTQQAVEVAFGNELDCIDAMARKIYTEDYYHSIFEMQKGFGIGWEIGQIDEKKLDKFIKKPWAADGKHFSDRIWQQRGQLVSEIHQQLTRTCILGKSPDDAIKAISKKFGTTKSNAGRLVMTEQAYFHSVAQKGAFEALDVEEFEIVATLDSETSEICQEMDGKHFPMSTYEAGVTAPPFHPWCRSVTVPYFEDNFTGERAARGANGKTKYVPDSLTYREWKNNFVKSSSLDGIRDPVDIEFDTTVSGCKSVSGGHSIRSNGMKFGQESKIVTLNKRNTTEWNELPTDIKNQLQFTSMKNNPFRIEKGNYEVQRYVEGSIDCIERDEVAKELGAEYIGFAFQRKNNQPIFIDFYQKGDELFYSIGKADLQKTVTDGSLETIKKTLLEREKLIIEEIGETNCKNIALRQGDEWVSSMKEFHRTIHADGKPVILSDAEYDAINSPALYRGIAPQSNLRKDITTNLSTQDMADEFFNGDSPFPSRGIYGDGIAYASPAYKIAWNYATGGRQKLRGGVIIEFKLKPNAKTIKYEDAVSLFKRLSKEDGSKLLFNPKQHNAYDKEVGKAMNALGYDAIIKPNGDNTGEYFYTILNRGALVTKKKYFTTAL